MSDGNFTAGKEFCLKNDEQCVKCIEHGCNNNQLEWEKLQSCVKCTPNKTNDCVIISDDFPATECALVTAGYANECYTIVKNDSIHRGCLGEALSEIRLECDDDLNDSCTVCNQPDCNRERVYIGDYCYECDSLDDGNCTEHLDVYMEKKCSPRRSGCYLIREYGNLFRTENI